MSRPLVHRKQGQTCHRIERETKTETKLLNHVYVPSSQLEREREREREIDREREREREREKREREREGIFLFLQEPGPLYSASGNKIFPGIRKFGIVHILIRDP